MCRFYFTSIVMFCHLIEVHISSTLCDMCTQRFLEVTCLALLQWSKSTVLFWVFFSKNTCTKFEKPKQNRTAEPPSHLLIHRKQACSLQTISQQQRSAIKCFVCGSTAVSSANKRQNRSTTYECQQGLDTLICSASFARHYSCYA